MDEIDFIETSSITNNLSNINENYNADLNGGQLSYCVPHNVDWKFKDLESPLNEILHNTNDFKCTEFDDGIEVQKKLIRKNRMDFEQQQEDEVIPNKRSTTTSGKKNREDHGKKNAKSIVGKRRLRKLQAKTELQHPTMKQPIQNTPRIDNKKRLLAIRRQQEREAVAQLFAKYQLNDSANEIGK
jgi:hypothetical protein